MSNPDNAIERVSRPLCRNDRRPEDIRMDGKPMWESYKPQAKAIISLLKDGDKLSHGLVVRMEKD
jgi:hypothetical protein